MDLSERAGDDGESPCLLTCREGDEAGCLVRRAQRLERRQPSERAGVHCPGSRLPDPFVPPTLHILTLPSPRTLILILTILTMTQTLASGSDGTDNQSDDVSKRAADPSAQRGSY